MFTENGVIIDMDEVAEVVDQCDVFTIGFRLFPQRVIIDTRQTQEAGPMVRVVEPVDSVEERFHWLGRERPQLAVPEKFSFFLWPHSMEFFEASGLAGRIRDRVGASERPDAAAMVDREFADLRSLERSAIQEALAGRGYQPLWPQD